MNTSCIFYLVLLVLAVKAEEDSSESSYEDDDVISVNFDDETPSNSSGSGGLGDLLKGLNLGQGGLGGLISSLSQSEQGSNLLSAFSGLSSGQGNDLLSSLSKLDLSQLGGKDLLSSLGKLDLSQLGGNDLLSSLGKLDLSQLGGKDSSSGKPNSNLKGLGGILNQLNSNGDKSGDFPLQKILKNPTLLNKLISGKRGRKLNFPDSTEEQEEEEEESDGDNTFLRLQMAYMNYVNIFKLNNKENEDGGFDPTKQTLVYTSDGLIRGNLVHEDGIDYYSFLGIPYAEKPERFQAPEIVKPWNGIKDATKEKEICIQYDDYLKLKGGSEDCLFLNIHTPTTNFENLPVLVWIHGGLFKFGTSSKIIYGPVRLIKEKVIVVSINYRLGPFGFLSTNTKHAPGNAGLKDIVVALRWLQKNIHMFGGDTNNICLYGVSTGGGMVEYLQLSKMAQGLFQKAIIQSGSTLSAQFFSEDPLKNAIKLAKYMGHYTNNVEDLMEFLSKADAFDIVKATEEMDKNESPLTWYFHFAPTTEEIIEGQERFLHDTPDRLLESGDYEQVPSLMGFNRDEGLHLLKYVEDIGEYLDSSNDIFEYLQPSDLFKCQNEPHVKRKALEKIKQFYFGGRRISLETLQGYIDMMGDVFFSNGVFKSLKYKSKHLQAPIYFSEFAYDGSVGLSKDYIFSNISGVAHADDLPYIFKFTVSDSLYRRDKGVQNVSKKMLYLYTNFLKYGNPTPSASEIVPLIWVPINKYKMPYLRIAESLEMKMNPNEERLNFWDKLYESTLKS